jgi:xanthine/uracil permease
MPAFDPAAALSVALAYVAVLVNATGSLFGVQPLVGADGMEKRLNRSLVLTGLSGLAPAPWACWARCPTRLSPGVITSRGSEAVIL